MFILFSWTSIKKEEMFKKALKYLNDHHYKNCVEYKYILDAIDYDRVEQKN